MNGLPRFALDRARCAVVLLAVGLGAAPAGALAVEVAALQLSAQSVPGGTSVQVGIRLASPAPLGGQVVSLLYSTTSVLDRPPAAVTIPGGSTGGSFVLATRPTAATTAVKIGARVGTVLKDATLTVRKPEVKTLRFTKRVHGESVQLDSPVLGGSPAFADIELDGPAPAGGLAVLLQLSPHAAFTLCTYHMYSEPTCSAAGPYYTDTFAAGETTKSYAFRLGPVRDSQNLLITASAGVPKSATLLLLQPRVDHVEFTTSCDRSAFSGISAVAQPTDLVARVYTKDEIPAGGAYAALSLSMAAAPISPTVQLRQSFQWRRNADLCSQAERYLMPPSCLEPPTTYHVGCVPIPAEVQVGPPRRLTLTATTGAMTDTATLDVGLVK